MSLLNDGKSINGDLLMNTPKLTSDDFGSH